ncbi:MAG: preprotein translocase subunit SecG [Paramuribaculum sp.]|nr:preprotein translocase subunit SecG [Paramuribaculum sp.]
MIFTILIILVILAAVLLIGVILIQKSKGGGLASSFAGANQIVGVRRTNNFIEKVTWSLAGAIAILAILSAWTMPNDAIQSKSRVKQANTEAAAATFDGNAEQPATEEAPVAVPEATPEATPELPAEAPAAE